MRFFIATSVVFATLSAQALPVYLNRLRSEFPESKFTKLCMTCHTGGGPQLNPFGKDFFETVVRGGRLNDDQAWLELKAKDSDQDGVNNEDEIKAGRQPGKKD